jgi:hypothetical protein
MPSASTNVTLKFVGDYVEWTTPAGGIWLQHVTLGTNPPCYIHYLIDGSQRVRIEWEQDDAKPYVPEFCTRNVVAVTYLDREPFEWTERP